MNDPLWFLVELFANVLLMLGGVALTIILAQRWYRKRNGENRSQHYANDRHQTITMWFALVIVFLLVPLMNLERTPDQWLFLFLIIPFCLLYLAIGTHLWKKVSNNKDNYWYDWWVSGGIFVWFVLFMMGRQWLGM